MKTAGGVILSLIGFLIQGLVLFMIPIGFSFLDRVNPETVYFNMSIFFSVAVILIAGGLYLLRDSRDASRVISMGQCLVSAIYLISNVCIYSSYFSAEGAVTNWTWIVLAITVVSSLIGILVGVIAWRDTRQLSEIDAP